MKFAPSRRRCRPGPGRHRDNSFRRRHGSPRGRCRRRSCRSPRRRRTASRPRAAGDLGPAAAGLDPIVPLPAVSVSNPPRRRFGVSAPADDLVAAVAGVDGVCPGPAINNVVSAPDAAFAVNRVVARAGVNGVAPGSAAIDGVPAVAADYGVVAIPPVMVTGTSTPAASIVFTPCWATTLIAAGPSYAVTRRPGWRSRRPCRGPATR